MRIVMASAEVSPFSKTGGLGDVAGSLPKHLRELGHEVIVITPRYSVVRENASCLSDMAGLRRTAIDFSIPVGKRMMPGALQRSQLPGSDVPVYFVENKHYFDRDGLYGTGGGHDNDYADNAERFIFFTRAVLEACRKLDFAPDVIHCNDWQTGLLPVYIRTTYGNMPEFANTASVFTIHNLVYQGNFWHWDMKLTGLDWYLFNWRHLEYFGNLNFMKGGIVFADVVSTVSKQYAKEIQSEEYGAGLNEILSDRSDDLFGIINGVDYSIWSPETDEHIAARYGPDDLSGKAECKAALQQAYNLPARDSGGPQKHGAPLIGIVSRLDKQKGFDIIADAIEGIMALDLQIVLLGTGDPQYHALFENLAERHPGKLGVNLTFDNALAHQIEAGADMFLMPSRYEPCGLNQLYSLKYGTVPIVRATGGLADTIIDATPDAIEGGTATGFSFEDYTPAELLATVRRAVETYSHRDVWARLVRHCMAQDWSWSRSANEYVDLYHVARSNVSRRRLAMP